MSRRRAKELAGALVLLTVAVNAVWICLLVLNVRDRSHGRPVLVRAAALRRRSRGRLRGRRLPRCDPEARKPDRLAAPRRRARIRPAPAGTAVCGVRRARPRRLASRRTRRSDLAQRDVGSRPLRAPADRLPLPDRPAPVASLASDGLDRGNLADPPDAAESRAREARSAVRGDRQPTRVALSVAGLVGGHRCGLRRRAGERGRRLRLGRRPVPPLPRRRARAAQMVRLRRGPHPARSDRAPHLRDVCARSV